MRIAFIYLLRKFTIKMDNHMRLYGFIYLFILILIVILAGIIIISDYGFQPENEVCLDYEHFNRTLDENKCYFDWRDKTERELKLEWCKENYDTTKAIT